ncbi:MAG: hypothetical protein MHMPM18_001383 [Marteilia pararefringens]
MDPKAQFTSQQMQAAQKLQEEIQTSRDSARAATQLFHARLWGIIAGVLALLMTLSVICAILNIRKRRRIGKMNMSTLKPVKKQPNQIQDVGDRNEVNGLDLDSIGELRMSNRSIGEEMGEVQQNEPEQKDKKKKKKEKRDNRKDAESISKKDE